MIVAAMIVGPGEADRYLERVFDAASQWADKLVAIADHVDERTDALLRAEIKAGTSEAEGNAVTVGWHLLTPRFTEDESHVRNLLMRELDDECEPGDLVVVLDADELLLVPPGSSTREALEALSLDSAHQAWSGTFYHLWSPDGAFYRCDGGWAPGPQFRVYRHEPGARVEERRMACKAIPSSAIPRAHSTLVFAHLGYARQKDRVRKHRRYMTLDGGRFHSRAHLESIIEPPQLAPFNG